MAEVGDGEVERRVGERRHLIDGKFVAQTAIAVAISAVSAFGASYLGTQTKTAVLENSVSSLKETVTSQGNETRLALNALTTLVNNSNKQNASDVSELRTGLIAKDKEIADLNKRYDHLFEYYNLQTSRLDALRDRTSRIEGELNRERKGATP